MKNAISVFLQTLLAVIILSPPAFSVPPEEHIKSGYNRLIDDLVVHGYCVYAARDIARYALMRQLLEDGIGRSPNISIVGIGSRYKDIMLILSCDKSIKINTVGMPEGTRCYAIYGKDAYIYSAIGISMIYDRAINHCTGFKKSDIELWNKCKDSNILYTIYRRKCVELIKKADKAYGPKTNIVLYWVDKYNELFNREIK
jgi:hypothetical protein